MKPLVLALAVALCGLGAAVGGAWTVQEARHRDTSTAAELRSLRAELVRQGESILALGQREVTFDSRCATSDAAIGTAIQQDFEAGVQRVLDRRDERSRLESEILAQPSNENLAAYAHGEQLVEGALISKRWTDAQAAALKDVLPQLTAKHAAELVQRLSVAVNEQQLSVQTSGLPF